MSEKFCYNCRFYKPYYTKGTIRFDKCNLGLCLQTKTTIEKHSAACQSFQCTYCVRINPKQAALSALTENLNIISELKQILEEDEEEALEAFLYERNRQKQREREQEQRRKKQEKNT